MPALQLRTGPTAEAGTPLIALIVGFGGAIVAVQLGRRDAAAAVLVVMAVVIASIEIRVPRYRCMSCYLAFRFWC